MVLWVLCRSGPYPRWDRWVRLDRFQVAQYLRLAQLVLSDRFLKAQYRPLDR